MVQRKILLIGLFALGVIIFATGIISGSMSICLLGVVVALPSAAIGIFLFLYSARMKVNKKEYKSKLVVNQKIFHGVITCIYFTNVLNVIRKSTKKKTNFIFANHADTKFPKPILNRFLSTNFSQKYNLVIKDGYRSVQCT